MKNATMLPKAQRRANTAQVRQPRSQRQVKPQYESEADVLEDLGIDPDRKLGKRQHQKIAEAARAESKRLRKTNPALASHLYYVAYKHTAGSGN